MDDAPSQRSSPSSSRSPSAASAPPVLFAFFVGIIVVACSKIAAAWIAVSAVGSKDPKDVVQVAAFVSNIGIVGITVAACALASLAFDRRTDRVVAAASLLGATVLVAVAVAS